MNVAASEFYGKDKTCDLNFKEENNNGSQKISEVQLKDLYKSFVSEYPITQRLTKLDLLLGALKL
ncbi:putative phosphopyruvate hydratase [Helianthus debilis subsp. tardiflorus]